MRAMPIRTIRPATGKPGHQGPLDILTPLPFFAFLAEATEGAGAETSALSQSKLARGGVKPGLAETYTPINLQELFEINKHPCYSADPV